MTLIECYEKIGGNYNDTLQRLCNEMLVTRFLLKFLDDTSYATLAEAIANKDGEAAFRAAHTLKGVALNLGLTTLFQPTEALTEALRSGWNDEAPDLFQPVKEVYDFTVATINEWNAAQ